MISESTTSTSVGPEKVQSSASVERMEEITVVRINQRGQGGVSSVTVVTASGIELRVVDRFLFR
jgi:hypothetical protein